MRGNTRKAEILNKLREGLSKSEVYQKFSEEMYDDELRKTLARRPSTSLSPKFKILHKVVCWFWTVIVLIECLSLVDFILGEFDIIVLLSLVVSIYIVIQLWRFDGYFYLPGIVWLIWGIFNTLSDLRSFPMNDPDYRLFMFIGLGYMVFLLLTIGLMYIVRKNVFGYYHWFQPAKNENGDILFEEPTTN